MMRSGGSPRGRRRRRRTTAVAVGGLPDVGGARAEAMVSSTAGSGAMVLLMIAPGLILVPKTLGLLKATSLAVVDVPTRPGKTCHT